MITQKCGMIESFSQSYEQKCFSFCSWSSIDWLEIKCSFPSELLFDFIDYMNSAI